MTTHKINLGKRRTGRYSNSPIFTVTFHNSQQTMSVSDDQVLELQRSFHAFDKNGSGFIEMDELKEGLQTLGYGISENGIGHLLEMVSFRCMA